MLGMSYHLPRRRNECSRDACRLEAGNTEKLLASYDAELKVISQRLTDTKPNPLLAELLYHRNSLCTVNRLPTEILQAIFRLAGRTMEGCSQTTEVLVISWTCAHWRTLALGDPRLWRYIDLRSVDLARLFVARSKPCTLVMDVHREWYGFSKTDVDRERVALCRDNLHRLGAMYYQPLSSTLPAWALDQPAPKLQELTIVNYYRYQNIYNSLCGNQTPNLRSLELLGCRLAWRAGLYRNLSRLKIEFYGLLPRPEKDQDLLALFRDSPHLESLELKIMDDKQFPWDPLPNPLLPADMYSLSDRPRIEVPKLNNLVLDLPSEYMLHILQSITLPSDMAHLDLTARADHDWLTGLLMSQRCLPNALFADLHELTVLHKFQYDTIASGIHGLGTRRDGAAYDLAVTFYPLRNDRRPAPLEPLVRTLAAEHPLPRVQHLRFVESSRISNRARERAAADMVALLAHCGAALRALTLHGGGGVLLQRIYGRAAEMRDAAAADPASAHPPLERLDSLAVTSMSLSADDFGCLVSLCRLLSVHLHRVRIAELSFTVSSSGKARELIKRFRELGLPETWWSDTEFWCEDEEIKCDIQNFSW